MQFYFIRHAQSTNNALWDETHTASGRSADPELSELGMQQARRLAEFLRIGDPDGGQIQAGDPVGFKLTHLYCSLMLRSVQTGHAISRALGIPLTGLEEIHEEGGIYLENPETGEREGQPGLGREYLEANFPGLIIPETMEAAGWWNRRSFEAPEDRPIRAQRVLASLLERHGNTEDRIAIVSHGGFYNHILRAIAGCSLGNLWGILFNCGISRFDFKPQYTDLIYLNRVDYLPAEMVT